MKKLVLASVSALAFLGLAACSDTDDTQTQSINPPADNQMQQEEPAATPPVENQTEQAPSE